jgi:hypothetical protein
MGASRVLGALLCVACVIVGAAEIYWGGILAWSVVPKAILLPVVIGVLVVVGLGFWLGWIMAGTKEAAPVAPATPAPSAARGKTKRKKK